DYYCAVGHSSGNYFF
nr:immunoglobulin light chain junction region [Macaca mulatta]MOX77835.1 immunoglobulin light chain junction region [Macaca mulatta]MOX78317.1 immunoglobulin light chain junction region [Macaca mulatta]MOX78318.1 immunoglobulin light chain junction region [Macaca mulatta]MOX78401.1 immunoglobulin light chain junction region [Macaca mulatta]